MTTDPATLRFLEGLARADHDPAAPLGLAFSGGVDSTALLVLAHRVLAPEQLVVLHVEHGLRPDSEADVVHCRRVAGTLDLRFDATRLDPGAVRSASAAHGPEGGLRELRYRALAERARALGLGQVALAHHGDDAVESLLLALLRGAGLAGLGGPRARVTRHGVDFLRPLLGLARADLEGVARAGLPELPWREDPSNTDLRFARNRVRHAVVPVLRELAGSGAPLRRALTNLRADRDALVALVERALDDLAVDPRAPVLDVRRLLEADPPWPDRVLVEAVRRWVAGWGRGYPPARGQVTRVVAALREPGRTRWLALPGMTLRVASGTVTLDRGDAPRVEAVSLSLGRVVRHAELGVSLRASIAPPAPPTRSEPERTVVFDADVLPDFERELLLRGVCPGDRFQPFGLAGAVRLRRWLAERGIARTDRALVPVVALGDDILWVVGHRRGAQAPVTDATRRCLVLDQEA